MAGEARGYCGPVRRGRLPGLVAVLTVLAACGDDEPSVDPEADQAAVDAAVLTVDDLPDGFTATESDDPEEDGSLDRCLEDVAGLSEAELDESRTARTAPMQFDSETAQLRARVNAFESDDLPEDVIDAFVDDEFTDCVEAGVGDEMTEAGVEMTDFEVLDPSFGPSDAVAYDIRLGLVAEGTEIDSRLMALLVGRYVVSLESTVLAGQEDEQLLIGSIEKMAGRLPTD